MPKKEYVHRDITLVGRTQDTDDDKACDVCKDGHEFLSSITKHDNRITYNKVEVDSEEGEKIYDKERFRHIPFIEDCKTFEKDGKPRCRKIEGFEEDDWDDLTELKEQHEQETSKAAEESEKTASEISEPNEPTTSSTTTT